MSLAMGAGTGGAQYVEAVAAEVSVVPGDLQDLVVVGERERVREDVDGGVCLQAWLSHISFRVLLLPVLLLIDFR